MSGNILEKLKGDLTSYKPIPFWSWNDKLEPEELRRQIRDMKKAGMGGFFMHARGGLLTEYLSDEWFDCIGASVEEAKKQGMHAWAYDENGWPSGFAGLKLLENPENHIHYLELQHQAAFDARALGCYRVENGELVKVTDDDGGPCECVYDRTDSSYVDVLNWKIVREFIEETHEKYYKRFGKDFGRYLSGFFTDEAQYYRDGTGYSPVMLTRYRQKYNEEMTDELGALFLDCAQAPRFRYRYWLLMNELYTQSFAGQLYRWCTEHDCLLTGHTVEESTLRAQMTYCAGVMPFYEYEHIPGMDALGRRTDTELAPRQVSSVAMQLGKKQVLTEAFAGCGWDVSPRELKRILEWQFVNGVNLLCHHLYPYSVRGQRKRDYPAFYSPNNPWARELKHFNDYFTRLGYMLAESREIADTLIIHPMHSAYIGFKRADESSIQALDASFAALVEKLGAAGILHHYADESLLKKYGSVKGRKLCVGKCAYSQVVVPDMEGLDDTTYTLLSEFVKNGGKICFAGEKPPHLINGEERQLTLKPNITLDELTNPGFSLSDKTTDIRLTVRRSEFGDFIYAVNLSETEKQRTVFSINAKGARRFNVEHPAFEQVYFERRETGIDIPLELEAGESTVLFLSSTAESAQKQPERKAAVISAVQGIIQECDDNTLTLDTARLSFDGNEYGELMPVSAISDKLLRERMNRTVYLKYEFSVNAKPSAIRLEAEYTGGAVLCVNGEELAADKEGSIDRLFRSYDLSTVIRIGKNELVFRLDYYQSEHVYDVFEDKFVTRLNKTGPMINCLSYITDIENVYLRGKFCVESENEYLPLGKTMLSNDGGFALTLPRRYITLNRLCEDGFPFFGGSIRFKTVINAAGGEKYLKLNGRYACARISVNGAAEHLIMLDDKADVSGELRRGANEVIITLTNSLRNVLGDFHLSRDSEPRFRGPNDYARYGSWIEGKSPSYAERYAFAYFGLDAIELM